MTDVLLIPDLTGPLQYAFFQKGLVVAAISGALLGFVGVYITLRGMSYIGHGLSHAIFGGFAAASLVSASFIYLGAGIWGVSSALAINWVSRKHRIGADAAIGVITTASFALGVALLSHYGSSGPSFDNALFGSIYGISTDQIVMLVGVSVATGLYVFLRYRSLLFTTFDPEVAAVSGVNVARTEAMLMLLLSLAILATLTVIGVTLVAAMLVIPAVVARMVTDSFSRMLVISTLGRRRLRSRRHVPQLLRRRPLRNHDRPDGGRGLHASPWHGRVAGPCCGRRGWTTTWTRPRPFRRPPGVLDARDTPALARRPRARLRAQRRHRRAGSALRPQGQQSHRVLLPRGDDPWVHHAGV